MDPSSRTVARGRSSDDEEQRGAWAWSRGDEEEASRRENKPREPEPQVPKPGEDGAVSGADLTRLMVEVLWCLVLTKGACGYPCHRS